MTVKPAEGYAWSSHRRMHRIYRHVQPRRRPILICGHERSGTSWIGHTLAQSPEALYYHEPCTGAYWGRNDEWHIGFHYLPREAADPYLETVLDSTFGGLVGPGCRWTSWRKHMRRLLGTYRIVIKEVRTLMSLEWVLTRFKPILIIPIRHPCAVVQSQIRRSFNAPRAIRELLRQPQLMTDHLQPYRELLEAADGPYESNAALWGARTRVGIDQSGKYPDCTIVRYEDLAADPLTWFQELYNICDLAWDRSIEYYIEQSTTTHRNGTYATHRVSSIHIDQWRRNMTTEQINAVFHTARQFQIPGYP